MDNQVKKQLISGVFYTAIAKYSGIIISLIVTAILARLITPDEFGVVAIATVIISFFGLFSDIGISAAIVQHKDLTTAELSDIFSFTFWVGVILSFAFFGSSWLIANYYDSPILRIICQLLAINLFFASANIVPNAIFYKNKEFKFIAMRSFAIQISCGALAVTAALLGAGLYALLITPILSSIFIFAISYIKHPQALRATWGLMSVKKIFSYSIFQFMFNLINYFSRNLDKLLIGKHMGMDLLGYYEKSYRLMMLPLQNITQVITPVMHPIFSDYQNNLQQLSTSYEKIIKLLAFIGFPLSVFLYFASKESMLILFGDQWLLSIPVFRILTLSIGIQIIMSSSGSIFQASYDTKSLFTCGLFSSITNVSGILLGIFHWGTLEAVAWCIVTTFAINFIQCFMQMYFITFKRNIIYFIKQLVSPLILSAILVAVLFPITHLVQEYNIYFTFALKFATSFIIFGFYIQLSHQYDLVGKFKNILSRRNK